MIRTNPKQIGFSLVLLSYAAILFCNNNLGIIDDHVLTTSLLIDKFIPMPIYPSIGRFFPLGWQEYNLVYILSNSVRYLYSINLIQLCVVIFLFFRLLKNELRIQKNTIYLILMGLIFSEGFVSAWFRLFVPDRGVFLFLLLGVFYYFKSQRQFRLKYIALCVISFNAAMYYKEPVFISLLVLAISNLLFVGNKIRTKTRVLDVLIVLSCLFYVLVYYYVVFINVENLYSGATHFDMVSYIKSAVRFALSDPFSIILLPVLFLYRLHDICLNKSIVNVYDTLLLSGVTYVLVILFLGVYGDYYLLPSYVYTIPALLHYLITNQYYKKKVIKTLTIISVLVYFFSSFLSSIHEISFQKNVPAGFQNSLNFLHKYIEESNADVIVAIDGVDASYTMEPLESIRKFMHYKLGNNKFVVIAKENKNNYDLLLITPRSVNYIDEQYIKQIADTHKPLYSYDPIMPVYDVSIKEVLKYLVLLYDPDNNTLKNKNIFNSQKFYIFKNIN